MDQRSTATPQIPAARTNTTRSFIHACIHLFLQSHSSHLFLYEAASLPVAVNMKRARQRTGFGRRANLVCARCHDRKVSGPVGEASFTAQTVQVRCDLQDQPGARCQNCQRNNEECQYVSWNFEKCPISHPVGLVLGDARKLWIQRQRQARQPLGRHWHHRTSVNHF